MTNPIKDNRIVSSHTYAVRYLSFLMSCYPSIPHPTLSGMDDEEYEYMCRTAVDLLKYQVETCPDSEKWYFENLVKDYKDYKNIIENHICKHHSEFYKFLKIIKAL